MWKYRISGITQTPQPTVAFKPCGSQREVKCVLEECSFACHTAVQGPEGPWDSAAIWEEATAAVTKDQHENINNYM